jgi:hypothetical protein
MNGLFHDLGLLSSIFRWYKVLKALSKLVGVAYTLDDVYVQFSERGEKGL